MSRRFQFSVRALFVTIAAVAVVLALMFQIPLEAARPTLVLLIPTGSALAITGIVYGRATARPFCIGALVPLSVMLVYGTAISARTGIYQMFVGDQREYLGGTLLAAIVLGYLCVAFAWQIEPQQPPNSEGERSP